MHSRYLRIERPQPERNGRTLHRWTAAERREWRAGADAQINGRQRSANPHAEYDGDLAEVLALAWWAGWDDTAAQDMSPIRELCGGEGGGA